MRLIKQVLLGLIGLSLLMFIFSLLLPSRVRISRGVLINRPADAITSYIAQIQNWKDWNPLMQADSASEFEYSGDSLVIWKNSNQKNTENSIWIRPRRDSIIPFVLNVYGQGELECGFTISVPAGVEGKSTQLEWWIVEKTGWTPWQKFYGIFADRLKGPVMEHALGQLKNRMEEP